MNYCKFARLTAAQRAVLIDRYLAGENLKSLLKDCCGWYRLQQLLREHGIPRRAIVGRPKKQYTSAWENAILKRYLNNEPTTTLYKDVSYLVLRDLLERRGIPKRKPLPRGIRKDWSRFIKDVQKGMRLQQLMSKHDVSRQRIWQLCRKFGIKKIYEK